MTAIEWADKTWNPVTGCTKVSPGCKFCYAERVAKRFPKKFNHFEVMEYPSRLATPTEWKKRQRIFVCSMSDLFHTGIDRAFLDCIFDTMEIEAPHHAYLLLTKRPDEMRDYIISRWGDDPPGNIWLGVSVESPEYLGRVETLLATPAVGRFISFEPLLGCMSNTPEDRHIAAIIKDIDWVIVGGESGAKARPMHPSWVMFIQNICANVETPFFFKQWGGAKPKAGGRELNGREYNEVPVEFWDLEEY